MSILISMFIPVVAIGSVAVVGSALIAVTGFFVGKLAGWGLKDNHAK